MKRGKDDEKLIAPMFPRLHVNDADKGGPRAPPRNKMALYEQLSIPSQRFVSGSASMLSLPSDDGSSLLPSMPSTPGNGYERSVFTPFPNSPAHSHPAEKLFSHSSRGARSDDTKASQEQKSMKVTNDQCSNSGQPLSSSAKCNSFQSSANFKNFSWRKHGDENDPRVHSPAQLGSTLHRNDSQHSEDQENRHCLNLSFSVQFQNASEKQRKGTGTVDVKEVDHLRRQIEDNGKAFRNCQDFMEGSPSVGLVKTSADASSSPSGKVSKVKSIKPLKHAYPSSNQEYRKNLVDVLRSFPGTNAQSHQELAVTAGQTYLRDNILVEPAGGIDKENVSMVRTESYVGATLEGDNRSSHDPKNGTNCCGDEKSVSLQGQDVERHDVVSEAYMVDSISALEITPDDVVGVIGEKQFWKARRAIVNQQRVFAVQVFELHRLIKVQKLIAGSPHVLLEDNIYVGRASLKVSAVKKAPSECAIEKSLTITKPKVHSQKRHSDTEVAGESAIGKLPPPPINNETSKEPVSQKSNCGSHSGSAPPAPVGKNTKPSPWCFPTTGNQWLVPIMSPSEGLVYKPYAGACPGFMAPVYGSCGPISLPAGGGDFFNAAYGFPASHQGIGIIPGTSPFGQAFFQPYSMPVTNPSISGSAVEQISPLYKPESKDNRLSVGDVNYTIPQQSSCNMSSQMSRSISRGVEKFQLSKESEFQGSTASSPSDRPKADALPLFPMEPTPQVSDTNTQTKQQTHVIKVVPHNPRSATESAARIFRSIQEERKLHD